MNYIRRAAGTVGGVASSAASYLPVVGSYFGEAPANNATRRNNRAANTAAAAAPAPAPIAAFTAPAAALASAPPAPAPVAVATGGGSAAEGTLARIRREREEREAAKRAAENAKKAATRNTFFATNSRKLEYANSASHQNAERLKRWQAMKPNYVPGHLGAAAAYTPPANAVERAAVFRNERMGKKTTVVTGVGKGTRRRRATRRTRRS